MTRFSIISIALILATGCRGGDSANADGTDGDETAGSSSSGAETEGEEQELTPSTRSQLQWKRNAALERDLMRALDLAADQVCSELGSGSCTPIVFDRVVLSACTNRATLDRDGTPVVFTAIDLDGGAAPAATDEAYGSTITALYQRLLSRDPDPEELTTLERLTVGPEGESVSGYDFAVLACFTIGTTTEFLFF
jgi:hypothetical protein